MQRPDLTNQLDERARERDYIQYIWMGLALRVMADMWVTNRCKQKLGRYMLYVGSAFEKGENGGK